MKNLFLIRGLPNAGKSTLAEQLGGSHFEADKYFVDESGNYNFDPSKLKLAHQWCQLQVLNAMIKSETIVVSNTFTREWEMKPYMDMAKDWGYRVFSIIVEKRHDNVNNHGVPYEKIQQMLDRFEIKLK